MTLNEYQELAQRTSGDGHDRVLNGCMGMCGESGECMDILKKHMMQGHAFDREKLIDELGDVFWYVAEAATGLGVTLDEVAQHNIDKLRKRYPDGFDVEHSVHREKYECVNG